MSKIKSTILLILVSLTLSSIILAGDTPCSSTFIGNDLVNFITINTEGSSDSGSNIPLCGDYNGEDYWLRFDAPTSGVVTIETKAGTITNAAMAVYYNACVEPNNLSVGCFADFDCGNVLMPSITLDNLVSGDEYFIRLWSEGGGTGTIDIRISDPFNQDYQLNGSAQDLDLNIQDFKCVELTDAIDGQSGCAWYPVPIDFSQQFELELALYFGTNDADGADGIALVFQTTGPQINCGGTGSGMGALGINNSFIIEFDTWNNGFSWSDPPQDHIAIDINGDIRNPIFGPEILPNIEDGQLHFVKVNWDPTLDLFKLQFDGVEYFAFNYNIIDIVFNGETEVYWGATSSTGGSNNLQYLCFNSITVTNNVSYDLEVAKTICLGDSIFVGGDFQKTEGTYKDVFQALNGCDSTVHTLLYIETIDAIGSEILELNCFNDSTLILDATNSIIDTPQNDLTNISINWTTSNGNIISGQDELMATINDSGIYNLTIVDSENGCLDELNIEVSAANIPIADAGTNVILDCNNSELNLNGSNPNFDSNIATLWTTNDGNILSGETTLMPVIDQLGTYTLTVLNTDNNCASTASVTVESNFDEPSVSISQQSELNCDNTTVSLLGNTSVDNNGLVFEWSTLDGNFQGTTTEPIVEVIAEGTYTLFVTVSSNGCTSSSSTVVSNNGEIPGISIDNIPTLDCQTTTAAINISVSNSDDNTYQWTTLDGNILSDEYSEIPEIDQQGTYQVLVTNNQNGCTNIESITIEEDIETPEIKVVEIPTLDCQTTTATVSIDVINSDNNTYLWTTLDGNILDGAESNSLLVDEAGIYEVLVINTANKCESVESIVVIENSESPNIIIDSPPLLTCNSTIITIDASQSSTGAEYVYEWRTSDGNIVSGFTNLNPVVDAEGMYMLTILNTTNGCSSEASIEVFENDDLPSNILTEVTPPPCYNETGSIEILDVVGGANDYTYSIDNGLTFSNDPVYNNLLPGSYQIIARDAYGCETGLELSIPEVLELNIEMVDTVLLFIGESFNLSLDLINFSESDITEVIWSPLSGISCDDCLEPTIDPNESTTYVVSILTESGCIVTSSIFVEINPKEEIFIPNVFRPGSIEEINGRFNVFAPENSIQQINKFVIYDRWSNLVFEQSNTEIVDLTGWDGTFNHQDAEAGVYVYYVEVEFVSGAVKVYVGDVTLLR